jgi:hypothetical protein
VGNTQFASQEFYPHGGPNYLPLKGTNDIFVLKRFFFFFFFGTNGYFGVWCAPPDACLRLLACLVFPKKARGLTDISGAFCSFKKQYLYGKLLSAPFVMIAKYINKISSGVLVDAMTHKCYDA